MPGCALRQQTAQGWSACCVTAPAHAPASVLRGASPELATARGCDDYGAGTAVAPGGAGSTTQPNPQVKPKPRPPSHYLWVALIARIYEVFPLICPICGGQMGIIAFITFSADIQKILDHIGVEPEAPRITPARGPPLWDECGAQESGEGVEATDQRTVW
jgi:hypothetical protein